MTSVWAPWRIEYFRLPKTERCFICDGISADRDRDHLLVHRGRRCVVVINRYPYTSGHLMVAPCRHVDTLESLDTEERAELLDLAVAAQTALGRLMRPDGYNLGLNLGEAAGAGLKDHLHLHVVPRWSGDTNFMSSVADLRVIPQGLLELWDELQRVWP
jgi:ATP adenylyltransferase